MKNIQSRTLAFMTIMALMVVITGCYPEEGGYTDEFDIVITGYDSTYDFSGINTYYMPDTVIAITDPDNPENNFEYGHEYDSLILAAMASQLNALGYQRVSDMILGDPDVAVRVSISSTTHIGNYWYDLYYYPWDESYDFTVGTVISTMVDLKPALTKSDTVNVVWLGAVNGLVGGSDIENRIQKSIDQMFIQSPYL